MKKLISILIAVMLTLPAICQEERIQKLESLENKTENKTETDSINQNWIFC